MRKLFTPLAALLFAASCGTVETPNAPDDESPAAPDVDPVLVGLHARRAELGLDANHTFSVRKKHTDDAGSQHVRVQQLYRGVPVIGGTATLHLDATGGERELTDALKRGISVDTTPKLTAAEAQAQVEAELMPSEYMGPPRVSLAILQDKKATDSRLVYQVHTAEKHPHRDVITYVDAHTGEIVGHKSGGAHLHGLANTFFSKNLPGAPFVIDVDAGDDTVFQLEDPVRGGGQCWDEQLGGGPMTSNSPGFGDGKSFSPGFTSRATACADAYWGRTVMWDMNQHVFNWKGTDGDGEGVDIGVHDPDNFNNGEFTTWADNIYIGDSNHTGGTMATVDIVGHEYGHAIVNETADLPIGDTGPGGGMNEGTGDILGALSRIYLLKGGHDTLSSRIPSTTMAERDDFYTHGLDTGFGFRRLFNPTIKYAPMVDDDTEEHQALGPWVRMFFFLAMGSSQDVTSDTWSHGAPWGMDGLGNDKAARIFFHMLTEFLQSGDEYAQARNRMISAVRDLFGQFGPEEKAVRNAFAAIDVGDPAVDAPNPPGLVQSLSTNTTVGNPQIVHFFTATPIANWLKVDVAGGGTGSHFFQITVPCEKTFGARLEGAGQYDLAIFAEGSTAPAATPIVAGNDRLIKLDSSAGCGLTSTFVVRVKATPTTPPFLPPYVLHMDRH